jgi:hypothetical protein
MRKQALYVLIALTLTTVPAIRPAHAQNVFASKFYIPFDFSIRGKPFPAGRYVVERSSSAESGFWMIRNERGNRGASFPVMQLESQAAPNNSQLVFVKYGDTFYLRKVWTAGQTTGYYVVKTDTERMLERKLEGSVARGEEVILVAGLN